MSKKSTKKQASYRKKAKSNLPKTKGPSKARVKQFHDLLKGGRDISLDNPDSKVSHRR